MLTSRQIKKIEKAAQKGTGCKLKLSKTQVKRGVIKFCGEEILSGIPMDTPLTNVQLVTYAKKLHINCFRGVFSKDQLPAEPNKRECGIINLEDSTGPGTHWTAYYKSPTKTFYFDSFGLSPPKEMLEYLKTEIIYNEEQVQGADDVVCGQYCLFILYHLNKNVNFFDTIKKCRR